MAHMGERIDSCTCVFTRQAILPKHHIVKFLYDVTTAAAVEYASYDLTKQRMGIVIHVCELKQAIEAAQQEAK